MALDTNLTAYYKFDNSAVTLDSVGSFTLTNTGTVASTASGKIGYGADFGNPNTTKWLTQAGFTFNSYPISISGWFYPNVVNDNGNLFSLGESSTNYYQIKLRNTDSHIVFRSNNATDAADVDTGVVASTNTWYHVVVVFNSTTNVDIYVNGTATNTGATVFVAGSLSKFAIGALARGTPIQPYSGIADEVGWWTRALTASDVTALYNSGTGFNPITLTTSTVAYYKFDESSGNASDSVNSVTLTNANVTYSTGKINNGAVFNSSTDSLSTSTYTNTNFERTNSFSISCWLNLTSLTSGSYIWDREDSATLRGLVWFVQSDGKLRVQFGNNNDGSNCIYVDSTASQVSTGNWYHIVLTYSGTSLASGFAMYVNGSSVGTTTLFNNLNATTQNTQSLYIGNRIAGGNDFSGTLDELGVWSRAITSGEVTSLYNGGTGVQYPFSTAYSIVFALGTYTYTGFDIAFTKALNMIFALGTYAYTGFDILFSIGKGIVFETGSYIYTGFDIGLNKALTMAFAVGSYTYTGFDILFNKGISMVIATGSYIYTGYNILLRRGGWRNTSKNSTTWTDQSKSSTTWTNTDKSI